MDLASERGKMPYEFFVIVGAQRVVDNWDDLVPKERLTDALCILESYRNAFRERHPRDEVSQPIQLEVSSTGKAGLQQSRNG